MRHPLDAFPRYALVVWKGDDKVCCIFLSTLPDAVQRGALVIGREFELVPTPQPQADGDPGGD